MEKQCSTIYCLQETKQNTPYYEDIKRWKKIYHGNKDKKKIRVSIVISDKVDIRAKKIPRDKECHFMIILMSVQQEDILTIYAPNKRISKQMKQNLIGLKGEIEKSTIIVRDFLTLLSIICKT